MSAQCWLISTMAMSSRAVNDLKASSMSLVGVLSLTRRKLDFFRRSTLPTPANKKPVMLSSSPITANSA